jgi:putative oxidoreductase
MIDETGNIDKSKLVIPQLAGFYGVVAPLGYAYIRVVIALVLLPDGLEKIFFGGADRIAAGNIAKLGLQYPNAWGWAVAILEFFGSFLLAFGLFTRPVAVALAVMLTVIVFGIAFPRGYFWMVNGGEVGLLLGFAVIGFIFGGGGRYSLDRVIGREF